jgi:selenocysteine-specific elongation factor
VILGTAGHIDHGKTTLVKALTGVDTDRLPEEKRRGITIVLGFAPLQLDGIGTVGVVDVPGHEAFVRTMVAGATGIDMGLLVIAADEGIMPQTREHVAILEHLGVNRGVVALTKADMVEEEWIALISADVSTLLRHHDPERSDGGASHHERSEGSVVDWPIIPVSAKTGQGIPELRAALVAAAKTVPAKQTADLFRLPIDRVFTAKGTGTVVTGTVWSGELKDGAPIRVLPENRELRTRGLQNHGHSVPAIGAGDRAAIALVGVEVSDISRGSVVVSDPSWQSTKSARAEVTMDSDHVTIGPRTRVRFHVGTSDVGAGLRVTLSGAAAVIPSKADSSSEAALQWKPSAAV